MSGRWTAQRDDPVPDDVARLLATVPDWFGQPEANAEYAHVAEIHLTVVDRSVHGTGVGTAMLTAIEADAAIRGVRLLEVKTLGPSHPDPGYALTRRFYEKWGFMPLEETTCGARAPPA